MSTDWHFTDVYDLTPEALQSVPHPVVATLFLYPIALSAKVCWLSRCNASGCFVAVLPV